MPLKAIHEKIDEIPENYRELYTEKDGKFELTGIQGIKTEADIGRLQRAIDKEKNDHKETKASLKGWTELGELEEIQGKLDKFPELEAAAAGKLDEDAIDAIAQKRAEGMVKSQLAPVERERNKLKSQLEDTEGELTTLRAEKVTGTIHKQLREAISTEKVLADYHEDVLLWGDRVLELDDEGRAVTKDKAGVTPGLPAAEWLQGMLETRPGWITPSKGGGSRGSGGGGGYAQNPWSSEHWNMTKQGQIVREKGMDVATRMAEAAGTKVGGRKPAAKK